MSTPSVTKFFKQTKTIIVSGTENNSGYENSAEKNSTLSTQFYEACLNEVSCKNGECIIKKNELRKQVDEMKKKYRDVEEAIRICELVIVEKDIKIDSLEKQIKSCCDVISEKEATTPSFNDFTMYLSSEKLAV